MNKHAESVVTATIAPDVSAFTASVARSLDLDKLRMAEFTDRVPFSIRYGHKRISDWARKNEHWPAARGRLWQLLADPKGTP